MLEQLDASEVIHSQRSQAVVAVSMLEYSSTSSQAKDWKKDLTDVERIIETYLMCEVGGHCQGLQAC